MNVKKAITIGLLTIATIGLVGCAIVLSKHKEYTPKTLQTDAYYTYDYEKLGNVDRYLITGQTDNPAQAPTTQNVIDQISYNFVITKANNTYTLVINSIDITRTNGFSLLTPLHVEQQTKTIAENERIVNIQIYRSNLQTTAQGSYQVNLQATYTLQINATNNYTYTNTYNVNSASYGTIYPSNQNSILQTTIEVENNINNINNIIDDSYENGYTAGYTNGEESTALYDEGYDAGHYEGYQEGYLTGYQTKGDLADGNFLDIRNMMLSVLTMPFTFINQAFNVTLWEGTAYAFNIGRFIKGLIAIASILFIIRLFTSGFSLIGNYADDHRARSDTHKLRQAQTQKAKAETRRTNKLADKGK